MPIPPTVLPVALVLVAVGPDLNTITVFLIVLPLALVDISSFPDLFWLTLGFDITLAYLLFYPNLGMCGVDICKAMYEVRQVKRT